MPLTFYTGPMKMGKSYEIVRKVMVPAFCSGRTIVTNVRGVDQALWESRLSPDKGCEFGKIIVVDDEFFLDDTVYPVFSKNMIMDAGRIPGGALVVIDEAYNVFGSGNRDPEFEGQKPQKMVTPRMVKWVLMHAHSTDDKGRCADIVMVAHDLALLAPRIRTVSETVFAVRNMRFLHGAFASKYRVIAYSSWRCTVTSQLSREIKKYDPEIFKLYKASDSKAGATTLFKGAAVAMSNKFLFLGAACIAMMIYGSYGTYQSLFGSKEAAAAPIDEIARAQKPDCSGSGVLLDLSGRRALVKGVWQNATIAPVSLDGRVGWDVGSCVFRFGGGTGGGRGSASYAG